jgi:hypothetical protein
MSELDKVRLSLIKKSIRGFVELHEDMMKSTPSLPAGETTTIRTGLPLNYWRALGIEKGRI